MSICQYVSMQHFSLGIKIKVVQNVISMSVCQNTSLHSQTIYSLLSIVIKRKIVQNVKRMSENSISLGIKMKVVQNATRKAKTAEKLESLGKARKGRGKPGKLSKIG